MSAVIQAENQIPANLEHVPANTVSGLMAMNAMKPLASLEDPDVIINRLLSGESIKDIAESYSIS